MKKIYITALHLSHGGIEMAISLLSNAFVECGYEVEILCSYHLGDPAYPLNSKVKVTYLTNVKPNREEFKAALHSKNPFKILKEGITSVTVLRQKEKSLKKAFQAITEGTIISTRNEHNVLLSKYGNAGVHKIAQLHHDHQFDKQLIHDFQNNYHNIDYFVLLTDQLCEEAKTFMAGHNTKTKCIAIGNFLDYTIKASHTPKKKQVVSVGRLHPVKGFDRLLEIWKDAVVSHPDWCLKIIGGGELFDHLKEKIGNLGLTNHVVLSGPLSHEEVLQEMKDSSLYAMSSLSEGFSFVLIEALMCELPVVAYDIRVAPRAIVEDHKEGFLIEDDNQAEFVQKLELLMDNESLRTQMSQNALEKSYQFTKQKVLDRWLKII